MGTEQYIIDAVGFYKKADSKPDCANSESGGFAELCLRRRF
jgi:hypothetical protein